MWPESGERQQPLRTGLTTGSCATACALAAARLLLTGQCHEQCSIKLPRGRTVLLPLVRCHTLDSTRALAATLKDAGDDPDVTHGAEVFVEVTLADAHGVTFAAAEGVGTVTRPGLPIAVGEPAINPVPRRMISEHLQQLADENGYAGGFRVAVGITNGAAIAAKTMNGRLGIVGGLSILGTTGIVRPYSCSAYIASIHQGIDVARANNINHVAASTGSSSEAFIRGHYHLTDNALIEMGDFAGAVLKYMKKQPMPRLTLAGGFGKISKLACGHLDLHSRASSIDFDFLARCAQQLGADDALQTTVAGANTSMEALQACRDQGIDIGDRVCRNAWAVAREVVPADVALDIWAVNRQGEPVGQYGADNL